jgi:hypothetical protein
MHLAWQLTAFLSHAAIAILAVAAWAFLIVPFWKRFGNYVSSGLIFGRAFYRRTGIARCCGC